MVNVKESKDVIVFLAKAGAVAKAELADGFQPTDLIAFATKCGMPLLDAIQGGDKVVEEMKDLEVSEGIELIEAAIADLVLSEKQAKIVKKVLVLLVGMVDLYHTVKE